MPAMPAMPATVSGTWAGPTSTGYKAVYRAPQFRLAVAGGMPAGTPVDVALAFTPSGDVAAGVAVEDAHGYRVVSWPGAGGATTRAQSRVFTPEPQALAATLAVGTPYTVIATTFTEGDAGSFTLSVTPTSANSSSLTVTLAPCGAYGREAEDAAADAEEAARRGAALASMAARAAARPRSTAAAHWADFAAAEEQVRRLRARCAGAGTNYHDPFSSNAGAALASSPPHAAAVWRPLGDIHPRPALVVGGYDAGDVRQGAIQNCYLHAGLALLADASRNPGAAAAAAGNDVGALLDAALVTASVNEEHVYGARFWVREAWQHVILDGRLPCHADRHHVLSRPGAVLAGAPNPSEGRWAVPLGAWSSDPRELWVCLLEKAWAKLCGGYAHVRGGTIAESVAALLPHAAGAMRVDVSRSGGCGGGGAESDDVLWASVRDWLARGWPVGLSSSAAAAGQGIVATHAYSLLRAVEVPAVAVAAAPLRLLQLRNPHGRGEWMGAYSDGDAAAWSPSVRAATGYSPEASGDDGLFWMALPDVRRHFSDAVVVRAVALACDAGGSYHKARGRAEWADGRGLPTDSSYLVSSLAGFPQFVLRPSAAGAFIVTVAQDDVAAALGGRGSASFAEADVAVFSVPSSLPLPITGDDLARHGTRLDEALSAAEAMQQEELRLPGPDDGRRLLLLPYFAGQLHAPRRGLSVAVVSTTPFELLAVERPRGGLTSAGVTTWDSDGCSDAPAAVPTPRAFPSPPPPPPPTSRQRELLPERVANPLNVTVGGEAMKIEARRSDAPSSALTASSSSSFALSSTDRDAADAPRNDGELRQVTCVGAFDALCGGIAAASRSLRRPSAPLKS